MKNWEELGGLVYGTLPETGVSYFPQVHMGHAPHVRFFSFQLSRPAALDMLSALRTRATVVARQLPVRGIGAIRPFANDGGQIYQPDSVHPYRVFFPGQTYVPSELNWVAPADPSAERRRRNQRSVTTVDDIEDINPFNVRLLSKFVSDGGKIWPRRFSRLTAKKQRKLAKSIKCARQLGLMPYSSKMNFESDSML